MTLRIAAALALASQMHAGAFSLAKDGKGAWNLVDPQGKAFYSKGCGVVNPADGSTKPGAPGYDVLKKYGNDKASWAKDAAKRLKRYGFNTVASWSDDAMYTTGMVYTHMLALSGYDKNRLVGVWSPPFKAKIEAQALAETSRWKNDPLLLGYYLDNELPWYGDTGWPGPHNTPLINKYLALAPGEDRSQAENSLIEYYKGSKAPENGQYPVKLQASFAAKVAEQYFSVCEAALKKADPTHLNLGVRFAGQAYDGIVQACGRHVDVVSLNMYSKGGEFNVKLADRMHVLSGMKPMIITEFSYRAMENRSGDKNTAGADVTVPTQKDRATRLKSFLKGGLDLPYLVGYHWFQYADESPQGRSFDGEDSNYGIVDIHDAEYEELREAFMDVNRGAEAAHAKASHVVPKDAAESREPRLREIGQMTAPGAASRVFLSFDSCKTDRVNFWNEATAKGSFGCEGKALKLSFQSGSGWGLGWGFAPEAGDNKDGSANLLKYRRLDFRATVEAGKKFSLFLSESGVAEPGQKEYAGLGGADGESWESGVFEGTGKAQVYSVNLAELQPRTAWGNQDGNKIIDIQAVKSLDLYVGGGQGSGQITVERLVFFE